MKNSCKILCKSIFLVICCFSFSSCSFNEYWKKAILGNFPIIGHFVQQNFKTYTSIIGIEKSMKLVTAKQQLDFINIMEGKDGRYLEVSTYEVKAGIDCAKIKEEKNEQNETFAIYPSVELFSSSKIHSVVIRTAADKNNSDFYEECIKPVNIAYEQKAKDYAVELGILENAKKMAEENLEKLVNAKADLTIDSYKKNYEVKYLPFSLEVADGYFEEKGMNIQAIADDKFYRDSLLIESKGNEDWKIRIGDTGRIFSGTFSKFYKNVRDTNIAENNFGKDRVEIFRYFDPMYPKESEILGYASDFFRTMFLLHDGRIYYVDAECKSDQTLLDRLSPTMVYIAASLRKIQNEQVTHYDDYKSYISNFFDVQESIRNNDNRITLMNNVNRLLKSNVLQKEREFSSDEKYCLAVADTKALGRTKENISVTQTGDKEFDSLTALIKDLLVSNDNFSSNESREKALLATSELDTKLYHQKGKKAANSQYLLTYFLQNANAFNLSEDEKKRYEDDIKSGDTLIASRPIIARLSDNERNEYFYNLFRNHLSTAHFFVDTAEVIDDKLKKSVRDTNMFVYFNLPEFEELPDGFVYKQLKKQNKDKDISNAFILVFNQIDWDFGSLGKDNDIHAIVLDDATLRFFPNIGSLNIGEKIQEKLNNAANVVMDSTAGKIMTYAILPLPAAFAIDGMRNKNEESVYFFYGDWKNLRITPESVTINGQSFATHKITNRGKSAYRNTNDYAEKSVIASVIDDLQHAYSNDDSVYYYRVLCDNLDYQIQRYVYEIIFRPSPRMLLDTREDAMHRYNK